MNWMALKARWGFTLIEAMVSLSVVAMAGSVMLLAVEGVLSTTNDAVDQTIAEGMAMQLIDEVLGCRFSETPNAWETTLGPSTTEFRGHKRDRFNDTDDFDGFVTSPPRDSYAVLLGQGDYRGNSRPTALCNSNTEFQNWRQKIEVYYVSESDPRIRLPDHQPSDFRAVEVTIERIEPNGAARPLANLRRVFCYVPKP
jgi:type II secretory pathway pseudopilin PulG